MLDLKSLLFCKPSVLLPLSCLIFAATLWSRQDHLRFPKESSTGAQRSHPTFPGLVGPGDSIAHWLCLRLFPKTHHLPPGVGPARSYKYGSLGFSQMSNHSRSFSWCFASIPLLPSQEHGFNHLSFSAMSSHPCSLLGHSIQYTNMLLPFIHSSFKKKTQPLLTPPFFTITTSLLSFPLEQNSMKRRTREYLTNGANY